MDPMLDIMEQRDRADTWIVGPDTGVSSMIIWSVMKGVPYQQFFPSPPHDPYDFGRCYRLLELIPSWKQRLPEVAQHYPEWGPLIEQWPRLEDMYRAAVRAVVIEGDRQGFRFREFSEMDDLMRHLRPV